MPAPTATSSQIRDSAVVCLVKVAQRSWGKLAREGLALLPTHRVSLLLNGVTGVASMTTWRDRLKLGFWLTADRSWVRQFGEEALPSVRSQARKYRITPRG